MGNDIPSSCSTHQYFGSSKYELLTPSQSGDMNFSFLPTRKTVFYSVTLCNLHKVFMKNTCFCNFCFRVEKNILKNFFSKQNFLGHTPYVKSLKINFQSNPTTELAARVPDMPTRFSSKMKLLPMFWDILQRAQSYTKKTLRRLCVYRRDRGCRTTFL